MEYRQITQYLAVMVTRFISFLDVMCLSGYEFGIKFSSAGLMTSERSKI